MKTAATAFALVTLFVLVFAGLGSNQTLYRSPIHAIDYNNFWAAYVPEVVAGYRVLAITRIKGGGCPPTTIISLEHPPEHMDGPLRVWPDSDTLKREFRSIPGFPEDIYLSFSSPSLDNGENAARDRDWNGSVGEIECIRFGGPVDVDVGSLEEE